MPRTPSLFTGVTGVLFAGCIAMAQLLFMSALKFGAVSVTTFIYSSGFLIPTLAGVLYTIILTAVLGKIVFRERVSLRKWIGIAIGIAAIIVISR